MHVGYCAEASLEHVNLILNVGDRLTEGLAVTSEVGSRAFHAHRVLVRLASTLNALSEARMVSAGALRDAGTAFAEPQVAQHQVHAHSKA